MANYITDPNMGFLNPIPGVDPAPDYALNISNSLATIGSHNHSAGNGVTISPSGLSISSDLPFLSNNATYLRSCRFVPQNSPLALPTDVGCIYVSGLDFYLNDISGNQIRVTSGGSLAGAAGTISGLPSGTAAASYGSGTFVFQAATSTAAVLDCGSIILRNSTASSKGLTLSPPNAMASNYGLVLPALPIGQSFVTLDSSGNITAPTSYPLTAAGITAGTITTTQIADQTIAQGNLALRATGTSVAAGGYASSGSSGTFSTGSTNMTTVASCGVTIVTTGRPVQICVQNDGSGNPSLFQQVSSTISYYQVLRGSTTLGYTECQAVSGLWQGSPGFTIIDPVGAGTWTYYFQVQAGSGGTFRAYYMQITAYET